MKRLLVIDGQGGKIGMQVISAVRERKLPVYITAVGTNSIATANMLKCSPDGAATGENPVVVACRDADVIVGPVGIAVADSLLGEVTPKMAIAVGQSRAVRILIPVNKCESIVVGVNEVPFAELICEAVDKIEGHI